MAEQSNDLTNVMKGLQTFGSKYLGRFDEWHKNTCISLRMSRRSAFNIIRGQTRPAIADGTTNVTRFQAEYDRCNEQLFAILHPAADKPASLLLRMHEVVAGPSGIGHNVYQLL